MGYPGDQAPRQAPYRSYEPPTGPPSGPYGGPHGGAPQSAEQHGSRDPFDAFGGTGRPQAAPGPSGPGPSFPGPSRTGDGFQAFQPASARQPGSAQPGPNQSGPNQPGPAQFGPAQLGPNQPGPAQPGPAQPAQASGGERQWDASDVVLPRPPSRRRPLLLSVGAVAVLMAAGGGLYYVAAQRDAQQSAATAAASPTSSPVAGSDRPSGKYGYATSRASDPLPLQQKELFPKTKIKVGKRTYLKTASRNDKVCKNAVEGSNIQKALKAAGCSQIVRASFQDASGKIIATIGVANLKTSAGAKKVASAGAAKERKDYVKPLQGKTGATKSLGSGEAMAGVWTHGHYAVLLWFQFKDGHKPSSAEIKQLNAAASDITDTTVFPALDTRALTGGRG